MKNSTFMKGLLVTSLAFLSANMPASAQEATEEPQDSVETVQTVYQMVDHITSGKNYVIGVMTDNGDWLPVSAPPSFGFYPAIGRLMCEGPSSFELNDYMQIVPNPQAYLPSFTITEDENGFLINTGYGYLGINKPYDDGKDDKDKKDDKDDGKGQSMEYTFLVDTILVADNYWDIAYDNTLGGFAVKNKGTNTSWGLDCDMLTSVDENNEPIVTYDYRIVAYETLPTDLISPIYFFEQQEVTSTGIESAEMDQSKEPKMVYSLSGVLMGHSTEGLKPGVYVVKQGKSVQKIMIK